MKTGIEHTTSGGFVATINRRLPARDIVGVPEIGEAFDVGGKTVAAWIEAGRLEAVDYSTSPDRQVWRATRDAVIALAMKMEKGEV
jgi:hypothetical protein